MHRLLGRRFQIATGRLPHRARRRLITQQPHVMTEKMKSSSLAVAHRRQLRARAPQLRRRHHLADQLSDRDHARRVAILRAR